jgi:predicted ABC-class ATPase
VKSSEDLRRTLIRIDGRGYKAYREIRGAFEFGRFTLYVDHVQGDPFASPSKLRARVPQSEAQIPARLFDGAVRRIACEDFLARRVRDTIRRGGAERRGSGKSGVIGVDAGRQEVLQRTAVVVTADWVEVRLHLGLPAAGRRVLGRQAEAMLFRDLPQIVERGLCWAQLPQEEARRFVDAVENQEQIREGLEKLGLIAFVGDSAILPRESGASDRPLRAAGMGIRRGVTLIVGGGYHGKSTLLRALERGVYPHIPGDGREWVVSARDLVKIRAEDGRRVEQVDISAFINDLPQGRSTCAFSSDDASGSTSQAANIVEAIEAGATGLLLDEDTSATNFMVRDARMQALVSARFEPITPFLERVREIYETLDVSTVLVMGGCGDYFDVADYVIAMREFRPFDATDQAKRIAAEQSSGRRVEVDSPMAGIAERIPLAQSFDPSRGRRDVKIDAKALDLILFGGDAIDLRCVEQLLDLSQTRAVGNAIHLAAERFMDGSATLRQVLGRLDELFDRSGLDELDPFHRAEQHPGELARPRRFEVAAAINRLRTVRMKQRPRASE